MSDGAQVPTVCVAHVRRASEKSKSSDSGERIGVTNAYLYFLSTPVRVAIVAICVRVSHA